MSNAAIQQAQQAEFVFRGKGRDYTFKFLMVADESGKAYPWIPIKEVEQKLYFEESASHSGCKQALSPEGHILEMRAATMLRPEFRMVTEDGRSWVRASGVFQILCRMDAPICEVFRDQLGAWLESEVARGAAKLQSGGYAQSMADANQLQGNGIEMMEMLHQEFHERFSGILGLLKEHRQGIAAAHQEIAVVKEDSKETRAIAEASRAIAEANAKLVRDAFDQGWLITLDYLKEVAPELANQDTSFRFGQFLAKVAKDNGGQKRQDGWFWKDGRQVSKRVPWPGHVSQTLNKWKREFLDAVWSRFAPTLNAPSVAGAEPAALLSEKDQWTRITERLIAEKSLGGIALQLAMNCQLAEMSVDGNGLRVVLDLPPAAERLRIPRTLERLQEALQQDLKREVSLEVRVRHATSVVEQ